MWLLICNTAVNTAASTEEWQEHTTPSVWFTYQIFIEIYIYICGDLLLCKTPANTA